MTCLKHTQKATQIINQAGGVLPIRPVDSLQNSAGGESTEGATNSILAAINALGQQFPEAGARREIIRSYLKNLPATAEVFHAYWQVLQDPDQSPAITNYSNFFLMVEKFRPQMPTNILALRSISAPPAKPMTEFSQQIFCDTVLALHQHPLIQKQLAQELQNLAQGQAVNWLNLETVYPTYWRALPNHAAAAAQMAKFLAICPREIVQAQAILNQNSEARIQIQQKARLTAYRNLISTAAIFAWPTDLEIRNCLFFFQQDSTLPANLKKDFQKAYAAVLDKEDLP